MAKNLYVVICYERLTSCNFLSSNLLGNMGRTKSYAYYTLVTGFDVLEDMDVVKPRIVTSEGLSANGRYESRMMNA